MLVCRLGCWPRTIVPFVSRCVYWVKAIWTKIKEWSRVKKFSTKTKGVSKGAPSGFVVSFVVHAAAFLLAGMFVVFTVHLKDKKKFVPPKPVERPKMKLKKPKVKVKKSAKPKSATRIVTKVKAPACRTSNCRK